MRMRVDEAGYNRFASRLIFLVSAVASARTLSLLPTARMRPSAIATACARGRRSSIVMIWALNRISSGAVRSRKSGGASAKAPSPPRNSRRDCKAVRGEAGSLSRFAAHVQSRYQAGALPPRNFPIMTNIISAQIDANRRALRHELLHDPAPSTYDAGIPPSHDRESAIVVELAPAPYTAVLRGFGETTGAALVEAYALQ